jgi:hypothetical protein
MKRLVLLAAILSTLSATCFAGFGLGASIGAGQTKSDVEKVKDSMTSYEYTKSFAIFGLEALYEQSGLFNLEEQHIFGAKIGYNGWNKEELKGYIPSVGYGKIEVKYYEIPLTLYYKYAPSKWNFGGGIGAALGKADDKFETVTKVYPFIAAGAEYRFTKLFGLGLDLRYNIAAKFEKDDAVFKDISGVQGALAARFYF